MQTAAKDPTSWLPKPKRNKLASLLNARPWDGLRGGYLRHAHHFLRDKSSDWSAEPPSGWQPSITVLGTQWALANRTWLVRLARQLCGEWIARLSWHAVKLGPLTIKPKVRET